MIRTLVRVSPLFLVAFASTVACQQPTATPPAPEAIELGRMTADSIVGEFADSADSTDSRESTDSTDS